MRGSFHVRPTAGRVKRIVHSVLVIGQVSYAMHPEMRAHAPPPRKKERRGNKETHTASGVPAGARPPKRTTNALAGTVTANATGTRNVSMSRPTQVIMPSRQRPASYMLWKITIFSILMYQKAIVRQHEPKAVDDNAARSNVTTNATICPVEGASPRASAKTTTAIPTAHR